MDMDSRPRVPSCALHTPTIDCVRTRARVRRSLEARKLGRSTFLEALEGLPEPLRRHQLQDSVQCNPRGTRAYAFGIVSSRRRPAGSGALAWSRHLLWPRARGREIIQYYRCTVTVLRVHWNVRVRCRLRSHRTPALRARRACRGHGRTHFAPSSRVTRVTHLH